METNLIILALFLLTLGIAATFFGFRLLNFIIATFGFTLGFTIGITLTGVNPLSSITADNFFSILVSLLFPIGLGAIFMIIALFFTRVGIALVGSMLVFSIVSSIGTALGYDPQNVNFFAAILAIFVFIGAFVLDFYRLIAIFVTSFNGALHISLAIGILITRNSSMMNNILAGNYLEFWKDIDIINKILIYVLWFVLGFIGSVFQLKTTKD